MPEIKVTSELNGMVQKLEKAVGEAVREGEALIILNCMKMEIPVLAPKSGKVKAILVEEGAVVAEGDVLATIET
jgi:biotin carboxyl carrier protein